MTDAKLPQETGVPESERTQALERFSLIRPFLEDGVPLVQIAREQTIPLRTLSRWVKRYREVGLVGLARLRRADKGERRGVAPDMKLLVEGLALQKPRRSVAAIHQQVTRVAAEQGWTAPSYSQVSAIIDALDPGASDRSLPFWIRRRRAIPSS